MTLLLLLPLLLVAVLTCQFVDNLGETLKLDRKTTSSSCNERKPARELKWKRKWRKGDW